MLPRRFGTPRWPRPTRDGLEGPLTSQEVSNKVGSLWDAE